MEKANVLGKKSGGTYLTSIIFLIFVIVLTGILYLFNGSLTRDIKDIKTDVITIEWKITEVQKDKKIQVYTLLKANKKIIDSLIARNNVTKFIGHIDEISDVYDLKLLWFFMVNNQIKTKWTSLNNENWIAYQKISHFIKTYRKDKNNLFDLGFVDWIKGIDNLKFSLNFQIK